MVKSDENENLTIAGNLSSAEVRAYKAEGYFVKEWDNIVVKKRPKPESQKLKRAVTYNRFGIRVVS